MRLLKLCLFGLFISQICNVDAFEVSYRILDYNSKQPIMGADIQLYNTTIIYQNYTDASGLASLAVSTINDFTLDIGRIGYSSYTSTRNYTHDEFEEIYLNPFSTAGIVRLTFGDLTFGSDRKFCIYFYDNNRLEDCYQINDTVLLHNNVHYIWKPQIQKIDLLSSPSKFSNNLYLFVSIITVFVIVIFIILTIIFIIMFLIFKKKGK